MDPLKQYDKPLFKVVKILLAVAAYGYLAYKLISYKDYSSLFSTWDTLNMERIGWLICALILFPLNLFLEAVKWRFLLKDIHPISYAEASRQVYCGYVGAFVTPYRVGDYPARAMDLGDKTLWGKATVLGFVGGAAQTIVIILFGIFPSIYYLNHNLNVVWVFLGVVICMAVILFAPRLIKEKFSFTTLLGAMGWSALRYAVFSWQLYAALLFVGAPMTLLDALSVIPLYYMLVTVTPNMPAADLGIRGGWAMVLFDRYTTIPLITLAILLIYIINTLLPTIIGSFLLYRRPTK